MWTLGGIRIIVQKDDEHPEVRLSEHVVLDGQESIIHNFGYGSDTRTLSAHLLASGTDYRYNTLKAAFQNGTTMALVSDMGAQGNYKIWNLTRTRIYDISRPWPVYQIGLELKTVGS